MCVSVHSVDDMGMEEQEGLTMKTDELKMAKFLLKKVDKEYPSLFKNGKLISPYGADSILRETTPTRVKEEIRLIRRLLLEVSKEL